MLLAFSCSIQELDNKTFSDDDSVERLTFTATLGDTYETKTEFVSSDAASWPIYWLPGDAINIFYGSRSEARFETSEDFTSAGPVTEFEGYLRAATGAADENGNITTQNFWGLYPYNENNTCDGNSVTLTIPSEQTGVAGTFANGLNPSVACSPNMGLTFYNVGSWFIFTVTQENVVSATLTGANGETLVGKVKVSMDENNRPKIDEVTEGSTSVTMTPEGGSFQKGEYYCMVILPGTFDNGVVLTLTKSNGSIAECAVKRTDGNPMVIERSKWARKKNADEGLEYVLTDVIDFADNAVKAICIDNWDTDGNGWLSYEEAAAVTSLSVLTKAEDSRSVFAGTSITSFNELVYFTGLTTIEDYAFDNCNALTSIILPENVIEIGAYAFYSCRNLTNLIIPNNVTRIGEGAFNTCDSLTEIIIPNGVTSIENRTFQICNSLTSITLGNSISKIGDFAFNGCGFSSITIPDGVTSIGESAFQACSLRSVSLPESVTVIGSAAFAGCNELVSISIPERVTSIKSYTFQGCSKLASISIPDGVTSVGLVAFQNCTSLQSIDLPQTVNQIGYSAFSGCTSLSSITIKAETIPTGGQNMFSNTNNCPIYVPAESVEAYKSAQYWSSYADRIQQEQPSNVIYYTSTDGNIVTPYDVTIFGANIVSNEYVNGRGAIIFDGDVRSIGKNAFYECENLTSLSIPPSVTSIGDWAFGYCHNMSAVTIPEGVRSIRDRAFVDCTSLVSLCIPSSVTLIGVYVFNHCYNLVSIVVSSDNQYYDSRENCNAIIRKSNNKLIRGTNNTVIPDGITSIDSYAFDRCSKLSAITIPNTVTSIGIYAFDHCSSLRSITIPEGVTTIDLFTFYGCSSLNTVNLPSTITSIKDDAFGNCTSLESIVIPQSVTSIGQYAFYGCSKLSAINIPESVTTIMDYTFTSCTSLKTIELPSNLYLIRPGAFKGCSSLLSITIPESVMYIQKEAFYNCSSLTSVIVNCLTPPSGGGGPGSYLMFENTRNCPIYVPAESVDAYKASEDWKSYAKRIQAIP